MNQDQIQQLVKSTVRAMLESSQYNFGSVQKHVHNGSDSPQIDLTDSSNGFIAGLGQLESGRYTVTDPRIGSGSIAVALVKDLSFPPNLVYSLAASFSGNNTMTFFEGSSTQSWQFYYIIIANTN